MSSINSVASIDLYCILPPTGPGVYLGVADIELASYIQTTLFSCTYCSSNDFRVYNYFT